jgi:glutamate dehydrogenase
MTNRAEQNKQELIDRVAERVNQRLEGGRAKLAEQFARLLYSHIPPDDIKGESADNLYGAALSLLGFAGQRKAGTAKVRVYNPRIEEQGWRSSHTIVEVNTDDMPFLVDSVTADLGVLGAEVHLVVHPIINAVRNAKGKLTALHPRGKGPASVMPESFMHVEITEQPVERHDQIRDGLEKVLADVRVAVADWKSMRARCRALIKELEQHPPGLPNTEIEQGIAFLKWLEDDNFTYLGYREYAFQGTGKKAFARVDEASGLGILRDMGYRVFDGLRDLGTLPRDVQDFVHQPVLLRITRANRRSTVHRPVHLNTVAVKSFDQNGKVIGERLFIGLFTSVAYSRSPHQIPMMREKVENIVERAGFAPSSHDGKALMHILETYPRDELFQITETELFETAMGILHLQERQRVALFARRDPFERFVSILVYVPRDRYDTALRLKFQEILEDTFQGTVITYNTHLAESALARLHVIITTRQGAIPDVDLQDLENKLAEASRTWFDRVQDALIEARGEEQGIRCAHSFAGGFPASYQDHFNEHAAVFDIARMEQAIESGELAMNLYRPIEAEPNELHFKIYNTGRAVSLSDILPMLEHMGLRVNSEIPFDVRPKGVDGSVWIHDFSTVIAGGGGLALSDVRGKFHEAFGQVWRGEMDNDGFNQLVLKAGLDAREVKVLRAYCKYLRQARIPFSQDYMEDTLAGNPRIARLLVQLFMARFDPDGGAAADTAAEKITAEIRELLDEVSNLDEDRIIRRFLNVIKSTLRTNFFQQGPDGEPLDRLSFKLNSQTVHELPLPRPFREIFVYSSRVEGVHLRFGMVARGGLRWSDRREDFRTEILGLVKAQQVKNAVIVPVGSKGGFVVKNPPSPEAGREAFLNEGIECYKTFIRGLLDITDNFSGGDIVSPERVRRHDGDDPYLVVAADKGTATFSDIANGVSQDYGHWLDDAFASGGSAGYDHKKMGITARGAWESVKRHFREIGKDIQNQDFTCVGVGDMSGDVFGNGMLLSKHIKLVGAFNHLHIFVDPDPDPAKSWVERDRLFALPRSNWSDYETKLMSKGGGIFDRKAKSIKVSPRMKALFAIEESQVTPNELIQAMLRSPVELLWFGGIGTYVKAAAESHADAGDRNSDALRIDAREIQARVVGEGANLGMTQRSRIEYAMAGGRLNSDSIDNSAGVDCSDHEVNIKILLGDVEQAGDMTRKQRNRLLEKMTDEVAAQVLVDNYLQTQAITVTCQLGAHLLDRLARFMRTLERADLLNRAVEYLPDDEMVLDRQKQGVGLTRPEVSVLLSYAKIVLYDEILESDLPDDPYMAEDRRDYFPAPLRKTYAKQIAQHRLHREIVATVATNDIVNRVGITFIHEVREKTGMPSEEIARAYMISREIFGMRDLWRQIEALDNKVPAGLQSAMLIECGRLIERVAVWILREVGAPLDVKHEIEAFQGGVSELADNFENLISEADCSFLTERSHGYTAQGAPKDLSRRIATLALLPPVCDIVRIARGADISVQEVGKTYFTVGARFGFDWLRRAAGQLPTDTAWDKLAVTAVVDDLFGHQSDLTTRVVNSGGDLAATELVIDAWADARRPLVARTEQLLSELKASGAPDLAMLAVTNRQLKSMVAS